MLNGVQEVCNAIHEFPLNTLQAFFATISKHHRCAEARRSPDGSNLHMFSFHFIKLRLINSGFRSTKYLSLEYWANF
jgi:hypothetical protein